MSASAWISILVVAVVFATMLARRGVPTDLLFLGGLVAVTVAGVLSPREALAGFANPAVMAIGALFIVAAGLRSTGVLDWVSHYLLGAARTEKGALLRLSGTVLGISAFINNTPVVAMFVPVVLEWCRKHGISPSRLLIPLSYLAIMGGTCTLIGTSTNLVISGMLRDEGLPTLGMFEIGRVGLPCSAIGALYLLLVGRRLLPDRTDLIERLGDQRREYLVEMLVEPECRLVGKTVEQAGLRHLRGLFLIEIDRLDEVITPVAPEDVIHRGDRLIFAGVVSTIVDLVRIPGLVPAADMTYRIQSQSDRSRHLSEAVISRSSPLIGTTVRRANFRRLYNAAVVAVHRNGARLQGKIGDIELEAGDTLLLQTRTEFASRFRNNRDFYLVASVEGSQPLRRDRAWIAVGLLGVLVAWLTASVWFDRSGLWPGLGEPAIAAIAIAGLMVVMRCLPVAEARSAIDLQVLLTIAAALGLGRALERSGAADAVARLLIESVGQDPRVLLAVIYLMALLFTESITNVAVAAMLFPLGVATAAAGACSPRPFVMAVALAASLSFLTPIGYQTNLMVMGPGGYQPRDYLRVGWPLAALMFVTAQVLIPLVWPFAP
jgi:di/tricarboxylate transporter